MNEDERQRILAAFGVTEDELGAVEAATGWNAAREAADSAREEFVAELRQHAAETSQELGDKLGVEVRWDDADA